MRDSALSSAASPAELPVPLTVRLDGDIAAARSHLDYLLEERDALLAEAAGGDTAYPWRVDAAWIDADPDDTGAAVRRMVEDGLAEIEVGGTWCLSRILVTATTDRVAVAVAEAAIVNAGGKIDSLNGYGHDCCGPLTQWDLHPRRADLPDIDEDLYASGAAPRPRVLSRAEALELLDADRAGRVRILGAIQPAADPDDLFGDGGRLPGGLSFEPDPDEE
jgi:hypothetical protein